MQVQLPDGSIGEFPDDMKQADIESVLQKHFQQPEVTNDTGISGAVGALGGVAGLVDAINPLAMGKDLVRDVKGLASGDYSNTPSVSGVTAPLRDAALALHQPQTDKGRYAQSAGLGFGSGLAFGPAGALIGAVGGAGSEAGGDLAGLFSDKLRPYGQFAGGILAGGKANTMGGRLIDRVTRPSLPELQATKNDLYSKASDSGAVYDPKALNEAVTTAETGLKGYNPAIHTGTKAVVNAAGKMKGTTLDDLDSLRQQGYNISDPKDAYMAQNISRAVNEFMTNPDNVVGGDASGVQTLLDARGANKTYQNNKLAGDLEKAVKQRGLGSTKPVAMMQAAKSVANDPTAMSYLDDSQRAALENAGAPGVLQRAAYKTSSLAPNSLMGLGVAGASLANPALLPLNALGVGGGILNRYIANRNFESALNALRTGKARPSSLLDIQKEKSRGLLR